MSTLRGYIRQLARQKNALILAHYYQTMDIQGVADFVGDSFELARRASDAGQALIVVCGVSFMAESVKLLSPGKTVLQPAPDAGCPMADMVTPEDVIAQRRSHPGAAVMCYVNSSAEVKAQSDICCTSSSAVRIARSLKEREIVFLPDRNLAAYVSSLLPEKIIIPFDGYCPIHNAATADDVRTGLRLRPRAKVAAHPECRPEVLALSDFVGSTSQLLEYIENSPHKSFLLGTELGVLERLRVTAPDKSVYLLSQGFVCRNMKKTSLQDVMRVLETETGAVEVDDAVAHGARRSLMRMIAS